MDMADPASARTPDPPRERSELSRVNRDRRNRHNGNCNSYFIAYFIDNHNRSRRDALIRADARVSFDAHECD
jgi:hypothetical protein